MDYILKTDDLHFSYGGEQLTVEVLNGVYLNIKKGQFIALLGHNGSGKSTLAKHFNAILLPTGGHVYVCGMDTLDESLTISIRQKAGMVFQNPDNQLVATVVEEDVAFAPENLGVPSAEIRERVDGALRDVGMYEYRNHAPHRLSGGQKQRVAIAGIIAMRPECIILDEPTAMLDPVGRREVLSTIHELNKTYNITVVLITHHMEEAVDADRVVIMSDGGILADGDPRSIFPRVELLREAGLSVPQTVELLYELERAGLDVRLDALTPDECADEIERLFSEGLDCTS